MSKTKKLNQGNVTILSIVISAILIGFGVTVTSVLTTAIISVTNINKSQTAYYQAEAGAELGYYIFAGHLSGFQYTSDNDTTCEIESGEDAWCLQGRLNSIPEDDTSFYSLKENGVLSVGLYNDISENPFEASLDSTTNVDLARHNILISIAPGPGAEKTSNNEVGIGDMRITGVTTTSDTYQEKTLVDSGHSDIETELLTSTEIICQEQNYTITGQDLIWDSGEFLYRDIDNSKTVSEGDIRMISTGSYGPGTTVIPGDSDLALVLNENVLNIGCSKDNPNYIYATDIAQIVVSGQNTGGNKSIIFVISKNQLKGKSGTDVLSFDKNSLIGNVNYLPGSGAPSCSIVDFLETDNSDCGNSGLGAMKEPQLQIYAFGEPLDFKITSTFSDFKIYNSGTGNTLASIIDIAGAVGASTDYYYTQSSSNTIDNFSIQNGTYTLSIQEYGGSSSVGITGITATSDMSATDLAINIQAALNGSTALSNQYSVNFRNNRFQIISTGITFTNPETTLIAKGKKDSFEQSIKTSITDSSLVPIFGWYSVF